MFCVGFFSITKKFWHYLFMFQYSSNNELLFSILSLDISKHRICISVGQHPDREHQHIIQKMKPIEYMPHEQKNFSKAMFKTRKEHVKKSIEKVVKKFNISGFAGSSAFAFKK